MKITPSIVFWAGGAWLLAVAFGQGFDMFVDGSPAEVVVKLTLASGFLFVAVMLGAMWRKVNDPTYQAVRVSFWAGIFAGVGLLTSLILAIANNRS